jgi:pyruvate kinase
MTPLPTRTKIVATLGPASDTAEAVQRLIEAGVSVFRLNFSHGTLDDHARRLHTVRHVASTLDRPIAVLGDLCGPKIRLGTVPAITPDTKGLMLTKGQEVIFRPEVTEAKLLPSGTALLPTSYPEMIHEVSPGHRVLINDGAVRMLCLERATIEGRPTLRCSVTVPGLITTRKGINLPDSNLSTPAITDADWDCVAWAVEHTLDYLALSFVRTASEVLLLRERLEQLCPINGRNTSGPRSLTANPTIPIVSKIEKPQAVANLDSIMDASDAVMVARGDLGVEMDLAQVPVVQRRILRSAAAYGKPCIVATQMLETMIDNAIPTRAEVSDVANAIFDGADAIMLSAETASGKHPALVVDTMRRIAAAAEADHHSTHQGPTPPAKWIESRHATAALAHGAWHLAHDINAKLVVCWSENGGTARFLSQQGFRCPIVAYTSSPLAARRMALLSNVTAIHREPPHTGTLAEFTDIAEADMESRGWAKHGDPIVLLAGKPLGEPRATNSLATLYCGDPMGGYRSLKS